MFVTFCNRAVFYVGRSNAFTGLSPSRFSLNPRFHSTDHSFSSGIRKFGGFERSLIRCSSDSAAWKMTSSKDTLSLSEYDAIGFDVDHTLAKYNIPHLFNVIHDGLVDYLIENRDWDKSLKEPFDIHKAFCTRGVILDIKRGNLLKLAQDGYILKVSHGSTFLSDEEINSVYGPERHWAATDQLIGRVDNIGDGEYMIFDNFYDCVGHVAIARMVDIIDDKMRSQGHPLIGNYRYIWEDAMAAYTDLYRYQAFQEDTGAFFPKFKRETPKFIFPLSAETKQWLRNLRKEGKTLFLMTSSYVDFARATLEYTLGGDWHDYFDLVLTRARKPGFFFKDTKFLQMDGAVEAKEVDTIEKGHIYSQGNLKDLTTFLKTTTGKETPKVLFFGDSLRSDIFPSKNAGWDTVMLVEEMHAEVPQDISRPEKDCTAEQCADNIEPSSKKPKVVDIPTLECEYLTSPAWGSFFTDGAKELPNNTYEMNTLWGYIIRKYADIAIPTLEHITDLPIDHRFKVFNHEDAEKLGFYPQLPVALKAKK